MIKYSRTKHGGELWAKLEVIAQVISPLFNWKNKNRGERKYEL